MASAVPPLPPSAGVRNPGDPRLLMLAAALWLTSWNCGGRSGTGTGGTAGGGGTSGGAGGTGGTDGGPGDVALGTGGASPQPGTGGTTPPGGASGSAGDTGGPGGGRGGSGDDAGAPADAAADQATCRTSVSGTVYDPAGLVPLYNVIVYAPTTALVALSDGPSCDRCGARLSGDPVAVTLTNSRGAFKLDGAPAGTNVRMVMQVGKWRREVLIPTVTACADTAITDVFLTRLPRDQSEGHLPLMGVVTGHADPLDCLLRTIGINDSEFTNDAGGGRVHMYVGGAGAVGDQGALRLVSGPVFADAYQTLFASATKLAQYDMLVLACEGEQLLAPKMLNAANVKVFADNGGRILAEHLQAPWFRAGPAPWPATATWIGVGADIGTATGSIDTSFAKGSALADWLVGVGASQTAGQLPLTMANHSVDAPLGLGTRRWIYTTTPTASVQNLTFNTPLENVPASQCGRVLFTDLHVGTGLGLSHPDVPFPVGCTGGPTLSEQQKALEFMFFDLSSCIAPDDIAPVPPPLGP